MKKRLLIIATLTLSTALTCLSLGAAAETDFADVAADAWYAEDIAYCQSNGLIEGVTATSFEPNTPTSRAMLVTILYRQAGSPTPTAATAEFSDVTSGSWYADAVAWAQSAAVVSGYADGSFRPNEAVTREQLAVILYRHAGSPTATATPTAFADQSAIAAYAADAVSWAQAAGIIGGREQNRFDPQAGATRAETAAMLHRYLSEPTTPDATNAPATTPDGNDTPNTTPSVIEQPTDTSSAETEGADGIRLAVKVGEQTFRAVMADNPTTQALIAHLPMTVTMGELNGNEKYHYLSANLPTAAERPGTINSGDLMLYGSDCIVLFYQTFQSSYSYTRLGRIEDPTGLAAAVGAGSVQVTFSLE